VKGGYLGITASPQRGVEEHVPKGEARRGVAVPPQSDESAGKFDGFRRAQYLSTIIKFFS